MRVSVHFDTDSDEFVYFAHTRQHSLGPPPMSLVHSFRQPSFHNLQAAEDIQQLRGVVVNYGRKVV